MKSPTVITVFLSQTLQLRHSLTYTLTMWNILCVLFCRDKVHAAFVAGNGVRSVGEENTKTSCQVGKGVQIVLECV